MTLSCYLQIILPCRCNKALPFPPFSAIFGRAKTLDGLAIQQSFHRYQLDAIEPLCLLAIKFIGNNEGDL